MRQVAIDAAAIPKVPTDVMTWEKNVIYASGFVFCIPYVRTLASQPWRGRERRARS